MQHQRANEPNPNPECNHAEAPTGATNDAASATKHIRRNGHVKMRAHACPCAPTCRHEIATRVQTLNGLPARTKPPRINALYLRPLAQTQQRTQSLLPMLSPSSAQKWPMRRHVRSLTRWSQRAPLRNPLENDSAHELASYQ